MANPNAHAIALAAANEALRGELADARAEIDRLRAAIDEARSQGYLHARVQVHIADGGTDLVVLVTAPTAIEATLAREITDILVETVTRVEP